MGSEREAWEAFVASCDTRYITVNVAPDEPITLDIVHRTEDDGSVSRFALRPRIVKLLLTAKQQHARTAI